MNKRIVLLLVSTLVVGLALACGGGEPTPSVTPTSITVPTAIQDPYVTITVTDSRGMDVVFDEAPQRIVSLSPAHTEILYALGLGDRVVGTDSFSDFPPDAGKKPTVGDAFTLNLEALFELEPDLVYTTWEAHVADVERLGIRVLYLFTATDLQAVLDNIVLMGRITDREEEARAVLADMEARINAVVDRLAAVEKGPRLFYELDPGLFTLGPDTFIGNILEILKVQNVAEGANSPFPQLSAEVIVEKDPEVIILGDSKEYLSSGITVAEVEARPGWSGITAVVEGQVYSFDDSLISRPGPRIVDGIEQLAELLYPELFP